MEVTHTPCSVPLFFNSSYTSQYTLNPISYKDSGIEISVKIFSKFEQSPGPTTESGSSMN